MKKFRLNECIKMMYAKFRRGLEDNLLTDLFLLSDQYYGDG